ncbi:Ankyrin repeat protein 3 [Giardia muris]|uniref:Ankyrin repeat protein 3 n=1 Tax=Giardia muris TaxID=5742 RepID=A0A4Z1TDH6_GIAMU|nr:Ankyrin repeat protein 3 [Giardia muris]|eukprot:TNJ30591.1 Ankyrin repeat protein 3 [Giardia muris]
MNLDAWFEAAERGDLQYIAANSTFQATKRRSDGLTALMIAANAGHLEVVKNLCSNEAGYTTNSGKAAIHYSIDHDRWDVTAVLLPLEGSLRTMSGDTPLHWAVRVGARECVTNLADRYRIDMNNSGQTAAALASSLNLEDLAALIVGVTHYSPVAVSIPPPPKFYGIDKPVAPTPPVEQMTKGTNSPTTEMDLSLPQPRFLSSQLASVDPSPSITIPPESTVESPQKVSNECKRLKEQNDSLLSQFQTALESVTSLQAENRKLVQELGEKDERIDGLTHELQAVRAELLEMREMSDQSFHITILNDKVREKDEEILRLQARITGLEQNTAELVKLTGDAIATRSLVVTNQLATQQDERTAIIVRSEAAEAKALELENKLQSAQDTINSLLKSQVSVQEQNTALLGTISDLNAQVQRLTQAGQETGKRISELDAQVAEKNAECAILREKLILASAQPSEALSMTSSMLQTTTLLSTLTPKDLSAEALAASISTRDVDGNTKLIVAAAAGDLHSVLALVGTQAGVSNNVGETALMKAAAAGHTDVVSALAKYQAGKASFSGKTALMEAALNGHTDICIMLAQQEAGMSRNDGWTALMSAARNNHCDIIRLLLEREVRRQTRDGTTALIKAVEHGHLEAATILAPREADLKMRNGATALIKCRRQQYPELYALLLAQEGDPRRVE